MPTPDFEATAEFRGDATLAHRWGCSCTLHSRRLFGAVLAAGAVTPVLGQDGLARDVGRRSGFTQLVSAAQVERAAAQQYRQMLDEAAKQRALAPPGHPQLVRLREISQRIVPFAVAWNPRAKDWRWEVNLIGSQQLNAFAMPGGKIAFYYGILEQLELSDDEVAAIMGHEIAHALREHARERMGKTFATRSAIEFGAALFGLGGGGRMLADMGGQLLTLTFSREDESEADLVGLDLAARAGYDPRAGVSLWRKMGAASKGAPPQWLSTHPSGATRIRDMQAALPKVEPLYASADKPTRRFAVAPPLAAASARARN